MSPVNYNKCIMIASIVFVLSSGKILAQAGNTRAAVPQTQVQSALPFDYCPPISAIYKKNALWWAHESWRSYSQSFVEKITRFVGAQWVGVNLGHIICLYRGQEAFTFPISLQRSTLIQEPTSGHWEKRPNGYLVCISNKRSDCPFPRQKQEKTINLQKILESIKT